MRQSERVICPYCNQPAEWTSNAAVYGREHGKSWMMWLCRCQPGFVYVGCHQNSRTPLGTMANKELRAWRIKAHAAIDPIWKDGRMQRQEVYDWLSERRGFRVHVGESDIAACRQIIHLAEQLEASLK
jgi:hypothetical protein